MDTLRTPPMSIEAEQNVLGGLVLVPEALAKVADFLNADDFYRHEHRVIFAAIAALTERKQPIDAVTVGEYLSATGEPIELGTSYVCELAANTVSAANITAYAEIVAEKARLRKLIETGMRLSGDAFKAGAEAARLVGDAIHDLSGMATAHRGGLEPAKVALRKMFATMSDRYARGAGLIGLPTPWHDLNTRLGGLEDSTLYIVAARPSMGKSIFGGQLAVMNALRSERVAWFSVEMGAAQCMARAVSCIGGVPYAWAKNPDKDDPDADLYWTRVGDATSRISASPLLIDDTPSLSIVQLMARARRMHLQAPLRLIVIDHAHDMKINPKLARFEYGDIAQGAKTLAKEFNCPVVLLAQLNRALETRTTKRPTLADLRESGEFEQKADVVIFLHRDDYYDKKRNPGLVEAIIAKGRDLDCGASIFLANRFAQMRMDDYDGVASREPDATAEAVARWERVTGRAAA